MHFGIKNTLKNNHNHIFQRINMFEIVIINYNLNYFLFKNILKKLLKKGGKLPISMSVNGNVDKNNKMPIRARRTSSRCNHGLWSPQK